MNAKTDFDAMVDLLDRTADLIPASAPPDWAGDLRLHYLQFVADFNALVRRARDLQGHLPVPAELHSPGPHTIVPTIIG